MPSKISRLPTRLIIIFTSIVLLVLAIHFGGIALLRYFTEKELHPALPRGTQIGEVHLNLFTGSLEIRDFELRGEEQRRIRAGEMIVDIDPWRLLFGQVHVERAELSSVYLRVDRRPDGSFDLGLPPFGDDREPAAEAAEPIDFSIAGANLKDVVIDYRDGELTSVLDIDFVKAGAYSLKADSQQVPVEWQLRWDERQIVGDARVALTDGEVAASGRVRTDLLDLGRVEQLARLDPTMSGQAGFSGDYAWQAATLTLNGDLQVPELAYRIAERNVTLRGLVFPGFHLKLVTAPQLDLEFTPGTGARADTWETELEGQRATGESVTLAGTLRYGSDGQIDVSDLNYRAAAVGWQDAGRRVSINDVQIAGRLQQSLSGETPFPALNATLAAASIEYADTPASLAVRIEDLKLTDFALSQLGEGGARQLGGQLTLAASEVIQADTALAWSGVDATLGGQVSREAVALSTDAAIDGLRVAVPQLPYGPLTLQRITANGLDLGEAVAFDRLRLQQLELPGEPPETTLRIASIDVAASAYSNAAGVDLGEVVIDGLQAAVIRDKAGQWRYPMSPPAAPGNDAAPPAGADSGTAQVSPPAGPASDTQPLAWRMAGVRVTGDSHLSVADNLNPDMTAPRFAIEKLAVGRLASDAPASDTPFEVVLRPDQYSEFVIDGQVRPLSPDLYLKAQGHLHGFAMQAFNGLVANDLGHRFVNGQLDNDFTIGIETNRLTMSNALALATVEAEEIPGKEGPPLGTAIALLEDRDGNIKLEVPISGDLTDPQFRVLGALNPIIMKAVAGTAALAIQPLGSVLLIGSLVADQALKVSFEPALFDPGVTTLNPAARKYLDQLAGKLKEKPKLGLKVCGVAVAAERKKNAKGEYVDKEEDLLALAQQRADAAREFLAGEGVGSKQLRACRPSFDAASEAKPRVDIKF